MLVYILSSSSKGNSTFIKYNDTRILIDAGISCKAICNKLQTINEDPKNLDAIIITHTHSDHIKGIDVFYKKYKTEIFMNENTYKTCINDISVTILEEVITIKDLKITSFMVSHDTPTIGLLITSNTEELVYITDTGYLNNKIFDTIKNKEIYIFESNHDIEMLNNGSYPHHLKQRILSDTGHLSNIDSSYYLSKHLVGDKTNSIVLAHLSDENNESSIAVDTLNKALKKRNKNIKLVTFATQEGLLLEKTHA